MGYTTDFDGKFKLSRPATEQERDYINLISNTRRMRRNVDTLFELYKGKYGNPFAKNKKEIYGLEGEYFAMDDDDMGQSDNKSIIDHNTPPGQLSYNSGKFDKIWEDNEKLIEKGKCQPGLWCKWEITEDCQYIKGFLEWNGAEKFYYYTEWLEYLIKHFFSKWGIKLNGQIHWQGESKGDKGIIFALNNKIKRVSSKSEMLQYERKLKLQKINEEL